MKDFENDLIYYPNPDPVKEPRFILNSVDELDANRNQLDMSIFQSTLQFLLFIHF